MKTIVKEARTRPEALKLVWESIPASTQEGKFVIRYDRDRKVAVVTVTLAA